MIKLFRKRINKTPELVESTIKYLKEEIIEYTQGSICPDEVDRLARECVNRLNFKNKYQMHRSLQSYAKNIVDNYIENNPG